MAHDGRVPQAVTRLAGVRPASTSHTPWQATRAIWVRVARLALPMWGSSTVRGARQQAGVHVGLALVDVEAGGEDGAGVQGVGQRLLVDHRSPGRVHHHGVGAQQGQLARPDEMAGGVGERDVDAHHVALGQEVVELGRRSPASPVGWRVWCSTCMPKPEARRATALPMRP